LDLLADDRVCIQIAQTFGDGLQKIVGLISKIVSYCLLFQLMLIVYSVLTKN